MITMRDDMLYIFKITEQELKNDKVEFTLSDECIYFDKGRAIYYHGFNSQYILIGFLQMALSEPVRSEVLGTTTEHGDMFTVGHHGLMIVWTGTWTHLERRGLVVSMFNSGFLNAIMNEIVKSVQENDGKLVDRS